MFSFLGITSLKVIGLFFIFIVSGVIGLVSYLDRDN